jgi:CheY-like chemotaxis protein
MNKHKVLIVDDVAVNRLMVNKMLGTFGMEVMEANNGLEALEALRTFKADVIILDLMMPVMDGFEMLRILRANPLTTHIPVIVLSALNTNDDIVAAYNAGANDFVTKPILFEKLVSSVNALLSE